MSQNETSSSGAFDAQQSMRWVCGFISCYAICLLPFLRHGFGTEAFGVRALLAIVLMLFVMVLKNAPEMQWFIGVWLIALGLQRVITFLNYRRHLEVHSLFEGHSLCQGHRLRIYNPWVVRLAAEPLLCGIVGMVITVLGWEIVGGFVFGGAIVLPIKTLLDHMHERIVLRRMRDAFIEQQYLAERFRRER